ncbi:hypothetical protein T439DRAFT_248438 [Meredithblackwellia eburnea MCA 4105]
MADPREAAIRETYVLFHAFLLAQSLPKTAGALAKELDKQQARLGAEIVDESKAAAYTGNELLALVRARIDHEKEKRNNLPRALLPRLLLKLPPYNHLLQVLNLPLLHLRLNPARILTLALMRRKR